MSASEDDTWAFYHLDYNPPTFDIFTFINTIVLYGATGIWFTLPEQGKLDEQRMESIVLPACRILGMKYVIKKEWPLKYVYPSHGKPRNSHRMGSVLSMKEPVPWNIPQKYMDMANDRFKGNRPGLVILRQLDIEPNRNSGPDWRRWASDHSFDVMEDYSVEPCDLEYRLACYSLASLNIGSSFGNTFINLYSRNPFLTLRFLPPGHKSGREGYWEKCGFPVGSQMPWSDKTQKIVWGGNDDYETIEKEFNSYMEDQSRE